MNDTSEAPRDRLGEAVAVGGFSRDDIGDVITAWLWSQFMEDRWAKLDQAQMPDAQKTRLASVFIDLSVETRGGLRESTFLRGWLELERASAIDHDERWVRQLANRYDPAYVSISRSKRGWGAKMARPRFYGDNGEVLVGGPGQGKSTITQMLAQCHRAATLRSRATAASPEQSRVLHEFEQDLAQAGLGVATYALLPLRVDLSRFAAWRTQKRGSLIDYIAADVSRRSQRTITGADVAILLPRLPWLLLLDGLDEVPTGGGRGAVVRHITEALVELRGTVGAVLVTTRPQGYRDEFGALSHSYLAPLSSEQIEQYAQRLASVRYADQPNEQDDVQRLLHDALANEATARLLRTPLQVTIMVTLVMQIGSAPRERWRLFSEYYRAVYNRETGKGGELARLLSTMRQHIDAIHRHMGLLLQVSSEREGETDATFSAELLRDVALARLESEGYATDRASTYADQIVEAALDRLVFLVELQQGKRLGFEIRSLQEYMAAWALTDGDDTQVSERLRVIAPVDHWRNTFVFAVGSVFDDGSTALRDAVTVGICRALHPETGRDLALDLLDDKTVLSRPKVTEALLDLVLEEMTDFPGGWRYVEVLLDRSIDDAHQSKARLMDAIDRSLGSLGGAPGDAWWFLHAFMRRAPADARRILERHWPSDDDARASIADWCRLIEWPASSTLPSHPPEEGVFVVAERVQGTYWESLVEEISPAALARALGQHRSGADYGKREETESSTLANYSVWLRLGLPDPPPRSRLAPDPEADYSPVLRKVTVRGIRALRDVEFTLPAPEPGHGQSVLLLGKNGSGKTTLLRALMFALVDSVITDVALQQSPSRYLNLSQGATVADCVVETEHGNFHTEIGARGDLEFARPRSPRSPRRPFVVAYGCRRGSAMGNADRDPGEAPFDAVCTLFDRPSGLVHCEAWLRQLHAAGNGDLVVFREVERVLLRVLPGVDRIYFEDARLRVSGAAVGEIDFIALSDGYLTTAGFVADIVYRWKLRAGRLGQKLAPGFVDAMLGVVLIDEIDLHLHPAWQTHILANLREAFPRMTFVGTTHNPLTLAGTKHVVELVRRDDGVHARTLTDDARLMTVAQIYRTFFSISELFPHPLGEKLRRYGLLAGDPMRTREQDAEVARIRRELVAEGADPGWEPVAREEESEPSQ